MSNKKILIVDDEEELLFLVDKKLSQEGYETFNAKSGVEAIEQAKQNLPDLILMDIVLVDMDGPETVKVLQDCLQTSNIPVIFLSGIVSRDDDSKMEVTVGSRQYKTIGKPFSPRELFDAVSLILN